MRRPSLPALPTLPALPAPPTQPAPAAPRDAGTATAELAVVLPVLALAALLAVWAVLVAAAHLRCVDAAGEGARALARGEAPADVEAVVRQVAPPGASVTLSRDGDLVQVSVDARIGWPGPWRGTAPAVEVGDRAVALAQDALIRPAPP